MWWNREECASDVVTNAEQLMQQWNFAASHRGVLWLQPSGPTLEPQDLTRLMESVAKPGRRPRFREVVFVLDRIETLGRPWTLVLAMMIRFGRTLHARCRMTGLQGQPAHVVALYRSGRTPAAERVG